MMFNIPVRHGWRYALTPVMHARMWLHPVVVLVYARLSRLHVNIESLRRACLRSLISVVDFDIEQTHE